MNSDYIKEALQLIFAMIVYRCLLFEKLFKYFVADEGLSSLKAIRF